MIFPACKSGYLLHILINNIGNRIVETVDGFFCLEENIGILGGTPCYRMLRIQGTIAEFLECLCINQLCHIFSFKGFNLLDLM